MTLPVTVLPPTTETNNVDGPGSYYRYRLRSKQPKPYDKPAPYKIWQVNTTEATLMGEAKTFGGMANASTVKSYELCSPVTHLSDRFSTPRAQALNSARAKLSAKLGEEAMLAVNWKERQRSLDMISNRSYQILSLYRAVRNKARYRIPYRATRRSLRQASIAGAKGLPKAAARAWLEFHFGVEPLIRDIGTAVELLQGPVPAGNVEAKGTRVTVDYDLFTRPNPNEWVRVQLDGWCQAKCGCNFSVSNPDLYLANKLGFVNPASFAWEIIPYSFLVDWFANVGEFIGQLSDLSGLSISDAYYTQVTKVPANSYEYHAYFLGGKFSRVEIKYCGFWVERTPGLPGITLGLRPMKRLSVSRAATAISLLLQHLKG